jgi:hypothetical protein
MKTDIFHPTVPMDERLSLMKSDAYRFVLHVTANMPDLLVGSVLSSTGTTTATKPSVVFCLANGTNVMMLEWLGVWRVLLSHGVNSKAWNLYVESERLMYIAKAVCNPRTKVHQKLCSIVAFARDMTDVERNMVLTCVRNSHYKLLNSRRTTLNYRDLLNSDQISTLLKVYFSEMTPLNVAHEHRQAFQTVREARERAKNVINEIKTAMEDMFATPKWLVAYMPGHGYRVSGVDVSLTWPGIIDSGQATRDLARHYVSTHPVQFYRTLDAMPEDVRDKFMGRLTLTKMHMQGRYPSLQYSVEPHDMVPTGLGNETIVCDELGSVLLGMNDTSVLMVNQ